VTGVDGGAKLIENAKRKEGGPTYYCYNYDQLRASIPDELTGQDGIVINFALFEEAPTLTLLSALRGLIGNKGFLIIQTVALPPTEKTAWRSEDWTGMATTYQAIMPWFYRDQQTLQTELGALPEWQLSYLHPVKHPISDDTLSWIIRLSAA